MKSNIIGALLLFSVLGMCYSNEVLVWNERMLGFFAGNNHAFPVGIQWHAELHTIGHEVLQTLGCDQSSSFLCTPEIATLSLAYGYSYGLNDKLPEQHPALTAIMRQYYEAEPNSAVRTFSKYVGESVAKKVIRERENSGLDEFDYVRMPDGPTANNEYPLRPCFLNQIIGLGNVTLYNQWASAKPYILPSMCHLGSLPPPPANSSVFRNDYNSTFYRGHANSTVRTAQETINAIYHDAGSRTEGASGIWTRLLAEFIKANNTGLYDSSVMMMLLTQSIHDDFGGVICEKIKWSTGRPCHLHVTGVASQLDLPKDPNWRPLIQNPSAGEYIGGHASGASLTVNLTTRWFGFDMPFNLTTFATNYAVAGNPPIPPQSFTGLVEFDYLSSLARQDAGLHFEFGNKAGREYGRLVATYVWNNKCPNNNCLKGK